MSLRSSRIYLANSLSRLEQERQVARRLIATLAPDDVDAVLRAWPRGARLLELGSAGPCSERDAEVPRSVEKLRRGF
jgi:hypothetical protein